jgi:hypothetical protein
MFKAGKSRGRKEPSDYIDHAILLVSMASLVIIAFAYVLYSLFATHTIEKDIQVILSAITAFAIAGAAVVAKEYRSFNKLNNQGEHISSISKDIRELKEKVRDRDLMVNIVEDLVQLETRRTQELTDLLKSIAYISGTQLEYERKIIGDATEQVKLLIKDKRSKMITAGAAAVYTKKELITLRNGGKVKAITFCLREKHSRYNDNAWQEYINANSKAGENGEVGRIFIATQQKICHSKNKKWVRAHFKEEREKSHLNGYYLDYVRYKQIIQQDVMKEIHHGFIIVDSVLAVKDYFYNENGDEYDLDSNEDPDTYRVEVTWNKDDIRKLEEAYNKIMIFYDDESQGTEDYPIKEMSSQFVIFE